MTVHMTQYKERNKKNVLITIENNSGICNDSFSYFQLMSFSFFGFQTYLIVKCVMYII